MHHALTDLRLSWRIFRYSPGLAVAAVVALALGIGFTTTMFSITHGGTRPLPVDDPASIVVLTATVPAQGADNLGARPFEFLLWRTSLESFEDLAAFRSASVNVSDDRDRPERLPATLVTPNAFSIVGARPFRGRAFGPADVAPGAAPVVIVGHRLWQERFGGDPAVVGQSLRLNGQPHTIVGVMPEGFAFPIRARLWLPLALPSSPDPTGAATLQVFGRLGPGTDADRATTELAIEMARLADARPEAFTGRSGRVFPFVDLETPPDIRRGLYLLVAVVSLALLIACANVANLLLARAATQVRDTAIRTALGASRARLVALRLAESLVLTAVAAGLGLVLASMGLRFFAEASADILDAYWMDFRVDLTVVAFVSLLGFVAATTAGLLPALRASSVGAGILIQQHATRLAGLRIGRLGRGLVVAQLAMACGLLIITATLVNAAASLRAVDLRFPAHDILAAQLSLPGEVVADPVRRRETLDALRTALEAAPDVTRAAFTNVYPGRGGGRVSFTLADTDSPADAPGPLTAMAIVTPEFFDLAGRAVARGRLLSWQDDDRAMPVAVVNDRWVARFSAGRDPLGRRFDLLGASYTIVGVVPDLLLGDVEDPPGPGVYLSMLQARPFAVRLMAATVGAPLDAVPSVRRAVERVDPDVPLVEIATLYDAIYADKAVLDALATLFFAFGVGAVFLAVIGLYAVLSFLVTSRTREFGVRMALGATRADIVRLLLGRGTQELAAGLGLGLTLALAISRLISSQIEQIPPAGPAVFVGIAALVTVGAALALWRPTRRAVGIEPADALRVD